MGSLIHLTPLAPGPLCAGGGTRVEVGIDSNGNGQLDPNEVQQTANICTGARSDAATPPIVDASSETADAPSSDAGRTDSGSGGNVIGCAPAAIPDGASFELLGRLPADGGDGTASTSPSSEAFAVSADGSTVVGSSVAHYTLTLSGPPPVYAPINHAIRWTPSGGMEDLGTGTAAGVSCDGNVVTSCYGGVVRYSDDWTFTSASGMTRLDPTAPAGSFVFLDRITATSTFVLAPVTPQGTKIILAKGISSVGNVVTGILAQEPQTQSSFVWDLVSGFTRIGAVGATVSAQAVSADGTTVVGSANGGAFVWTRSTGIEQICSSSSQSEAVNGNGRVVAVWDYVNGQDTIWDAKHGCRQLRAILAEHGVVAPAGLWINAVSHDARVFVGKVQGFVMDRQAFRAILPRGTFD